MTFDSPRETVVELLPEWTHGMGGTLLAFEDRESAAHKCCHVGGSPRGSHSPIAAGIEALTARHRLGAS